ncbi:unnamed protein product [Staurois parvus]|uniref:Uncharacterized protein n=1 Tax=Staurois parvus TaxID=386267 RepID=A0ABN9DR16_9NEOB|nr:unnamed protein product [Staurois parvus]
MSLTLVVSGRMSFTLVFIGKMSLILVVSTKMSLTMVLSEKNVPYIGGQREKCPLYRWSVERMSLTLVYSG